MSYAHTQDTHYSTPQVGQRYRAAASSQMPHFFAMVVWLSGSEDAVKTRINAAILHLTTTTTTMSHRDHSMSPRRRTTRDRYDVSDGRYYCPRSPSSPRHNHSSRPLSSRQDRLPQREHYSARSRQLSPAPPSGRRSQSPQEREEPNFAPSGALIGDSLYKGAPSRQARTTDNHKPTTTSTTPSLQYAEPPSARKPSHAYRLYVFKSGDIVDSFVLDQQSAYLFGRDRTVVDIPLDHPSCSKQHAILQYQLTVMPKFHEFDEKDNEEDQCEDGDVRPFLYDLGSANGTLLNGRAIPPRKYVELHIHDMLQFGLSSREYLLMREDEGEA
ncbi:smad nuclear-interacting protein 1 [Limtongia smithiae]|uniref:smad nuclear-interacting protein 1 n=1 Tax=Limtongia smithiae TaxID=1125753 RepID=UPI0034CF2E02